MVFKVFITHEFLQNLWTKQDQDTPPLPFYNPENGISLFQNQIRVYYLLWEVFLLMICMLFSEIKSLLFPKLCT